RASADTVRAAFASARAHAVAEGRAYRFSVIMGSSNFRVAPDGSDYWGENGSPPQGDDALILEKAIEKGIRFANLDTGQAVGGDGDSVISPDRASSPSQYSTVATLLPDGTSDQDVSITLQAKGATPLVVRMRALTGVVTVRYPDGGNRR